MSIPNIMSQNQLPFNSQLSLQPSSNPALNAMMPPQSMPQGPFPYQTMPPQSMPQQQGPGPNSAMPGEVIVEITRLLDMPMQEKFMSRDLKQYRVRAYEGLDDMELGQEIGQTRELAGRPEQGMNPSNDEAGYETETLRLGPEGTLRVRTNSQMIHLQVEYAGAFIGNMKIGRCRIARGDPRSRQIWPYALSNKMGDPVGCGVELRVMDGGASMDNPMNSRPGSQSFNNMPPSDRSMGPSNRMMPPTSGHPFFEDMPPGRPVSPGPSFRTMPPMSGTPPMPPMSGMMGPPFPPTGMPGSGPMQPSFQTMPPMGHGMPPGSGPMQPSFHTVPPLDFMAMQGGKGSGKGMMMPNTNSWSSPTNTPPGTPPFQGPSFGTMPSQGIWPQMGGQTPPQSPRGGLAVSKAIHRGQDVTDLVNQLIHANGLEDLTKGSRIRTIFGSDDAIKIWGPDQHKQIVLQTGSPPPYDLRSLFMAMPPTGMGSDMPVVVLAVVELDKIVDIPEPMNAVAEVVTVKLERLHGGELASLPHFDVKSCKGKRLLTRVTLRDLAQGSLEVVVVVYSGMGQHIGNSAPFAVSWKPATSQYVALQARDGGGMGGVYLSHRMTQDSAELHENKQERKAPEQMFAKPGADDLGGVSGMFKKGSENHCWEAAALAVEAQNRALHQKINLAKTAKEMKAQEDHEKKDKEKDLEWTLESNYRDWKNLDSVFVTLGPNYVCQSAEMGTTICRVYQENSSVLKELEEKAPGNGLGPCNSMDDEATMKDFVETMTSVDPSKAMTILRPVICKNVKAVQRIQGDSKGPMLAPRLKIKVHYATNLRTKAGFLSGEVHPKVVIEIVGKPASKWESSPSYDSARVEWNQEGMISDYNYGDSLSIKVVDKGWVGFDSHLGEAQLSGTDFYPDSFFAQVPLRNADKNKGNQAYGLKGPSILLEVMVVEPLGKSGQWPPVPAMYAPIKNCNPSDQEILRLANWDIHQNAKLPFADVNPNYQMNEDVWGALETMKSCSEQNTKMSGAGADWKPDRVKDACLMA